MMLENTLLWVYVAAMAIGALILFVMGRNSRSIPREEVLIAVFIPIWSGAAYLGMALGQGSVVTNGETTFFARYLDWVVTTPLLLLSLALVAMYRHKKNYTLIGALIGADVFMILTGLIADLSPEPIRFIWYGLGVAAFLVLLVLVWGPLRREATANPEARISGIFGKLATFLTVFWIAYPVTWLIGPSGLGIVSQEVDTFLFVLVPIISKVGFSLYGFSLLRSLPAHDTRVEPSGSAAHATAR